MPKKRGNIYEQKGKVGFVIRWKDTQGRRCSRLVKVASVAEAAAALAAEKSKVEKSRTLGMPLPTEETFAEFADEFLKLRERRISPRVVKGKLSQTEYNRQKGIIESHLKPFFGKETRLASIRRADVVKYIHQRTGQVSDASVIKEVNVLKHMLNVAIDLEKIPSNPAQRAPLPQAPEGRTRYLTPEQWTKVFNACYIPPDKDGNAQEQWLQQAAALAVSLGTRRGELLHTTVPDVDLDARTVLMRLTKSGKPRVTFINDLAMQVFEAMGIRERKQRKDRGVLFPGITPEQLSMKFIRACRDAGVEDFSFHDLRHTYASQLRMNGADLHDIQKLLGHSDMRMTTRYAHLSPEHLATAAARLNGVLTLPDGTQQPNSVQADTSRT